jgi:hypothetical protein
MCNVQRQCKSCAVLLCAFVVARVPQARSRVEATQAVLQKAVQYNTRVENATAKLNAELAASEHQAELTKLRSLIALNESLKQQEAQFKASCARQRAALRVRSWVVPHHSTAAVFLAVLLVM